jgi:hypothetical protein
LLATRDTLKICPGPWYGQSTRHLEVPGFLMSSDGENIIELLGPKETIGQAIAVLMTKHHVCRDEAFGILVQESAENHTRVRDIAATIIKQSRVGD